jgi:hypothetical protein
MRHARDMSNRRPVDGPIPLRADARLIRERNVWALVRASLAEVRAHGTNAKPVALVEKTWPNDDTAKLILRAPTSPTTTTSASALGQTIVADFIAATAPVSAAAALLDAGLQFQFGSAVGVSVPGFQASASTVVFVGEGAPIPVKQLVSSAALLTPRRMASISTLTEEMVAESNGNAELAVRDALTRSVGLALDSVLFDATAGDAIRPPGLRHGVAGVTPSTGSDFTAMLTDLKALTTAVTPIGGSIYFIVSPDRALAMTLLARGNLGSINVLPSAAIPANEILAIAVNGIVSAAEAMPQISTSRESILHMEDTAPADIVSGGTTASPVSSLWQTRAMGIRLTFEIDWAVRDARAVAWMSGVNW